MARNVATHANLNNAKLHANSTTLLGLFTAICRQEAPPTKD